MIGQGIRVACTSALTVTEGKRLPAVRQVYVSETVSVRKRFALGTDYQMILTSVSVAGGVSRATAQTAAPKTGSID